MLCLVHPQITLVADETGGMTRMLGLDLEPGKDGSGPRSQRWPTPLTPPCSLRLLPCCHTEQTPVSFLITFILHRGKRLFHS